MAETFEVKVPESFGEKTSQIFERNGKSYILFASIEQDDSPENPLEKGTASGMIYSLNHRHNSFNQDAVEDAVENNPDHVKLSYYEHGLCRWSVMGDSNPGEEFQWDGVRFAGVWVPDKDALANIDLEGLDTHPAARRQRILDYAKSICETYTQWCNGEVYGYIVALYQLRKDEDGDPIEDQDYYEVHAKKACIGDDSCWGFYGWDTVESAARDAAENLLDDIDDTAVDTSPKTVIAIDLNQKATILAALRKFQYDFLDMDADQIRNRCPGAEHFGGVMPLGSEDIDTLCEQIEAAGPDSGLVGRR